ncbi:4Fe-4S binding protein [Desulfovibrio sp. OttesenSCG-928-G15]|nr:4Fe-4S binding protein [Desulfovibrio sp. OttesenSCG-928-G15]
MKEITRDIVQIDEEKCTGCGQCILDCAEGAIALVDGKAKVIADMYCDGLGACLSGCPTGALTIIQRKAAPFDEQAVHEHLARKQKTPFAQGAPASCAPLLQPMPGKGHWPLKIRLMPSDAPFLAGSSLLVAADCAAFAKKDFHAAFAKDGAVILIGCPKFEGCRELTEKLSEMFRQSRLARVEVVRMEVPCCKALAKACLDAASSAGIAVKQTVLTRSGDVTLG